MPFSQDFLSRPGIPVIFSSLTPPGRKEVTGLHNYTSSSSKAVLCAGKWGGGGAWKQSGERGCGPHDQAVI